MEMYLSERNWGDASKYALVSMYEQQGLEFVLEMMRHPLFVKGHIPGYRVGHLLKELKSKDERRQVALLAEDLKIIPQVC